MLSKLVFSLPVDRKHQASLEAHSGWRVKVLPFEKGDLHDS